MATGSGGGILGQDPHFKNGAETDPASIRQYEAAIADRRGDVRNSPVSEGRNAIQGYAVRQPLDDGQGRVTNHFLSYLDMPEQLGGSRLPTRHPRTAPARPSRPGILRRGSGPAERDGTRPRPAQQVRKQSDLDLPATHGSTVNGASSGRVWLQRRSDELTAAVALKS